MWQIEKQDCVTMRFLIVYALALAVAVSTTWAFSWTQYHDLEDIYGFLEDTAELYPDETEIVELGTSHENRTIVGIRISSDLNDTTRRIVMIEAGIHAREWIVPAVTTYFVNELLTSDNTSISSLKDSVEWHIFPSVNPDGYVYSRTVDRFWRKTRSYNGSGCYGVDANRNFAYNWDETISVDPCAYQTYSGPYAFSEAETLALSNYVNNISSRLSGYIGLHSDEQCIYVPYSDSSDHIWNYDSMVQVGQKMVEYAATVNGSVWCGPATADEISYPARGMAPDWVYYAHNISMSYTVEMRGVNFQFPASNISVQGDEFTMMMLGMITEATTLGLFNETSTV